MKPSYISQGDPYKVTGNSMAKGTRTADPKGYLKAGHDKAFKPAKIISEKVPKPAYPYIEEKPGPKKNFRDPENNNDVIVGPRNIVTNPIKKGKVGKQTTLGGNVPYIEDPYDIKKKIAQEERKYHEEHVQEKPFSQKAKHTELFNSHKKVYMEDPPVPQRKPKASPPRPELHDKPFKPANPPKKGNHHTLQKFPQYLPNPPVEKKRVKKEEGMEEEERPGFKATYKGLSRPTPSVATNFRNLKSQFPSAFRR